MTTTTAPQPVSSLTVDTPHAPTPGTPHGPGRKLLAGLAATLVVAGGIGAYFAVNTTGPAATTPGPAQTVTSGGVDVIERATAGRSRSTDRPDVVEQPVPSPATVTSGGVDVIERSGGKADAESTTPSMADQYKGSTVSAESAAAASASHWTNMTSESSEDLQLAQWTASTRAGLASNDSDYGTHWNNVTTGAAVSHPVTSGGVDIIERQGCSARCLAAQARLEARAK